MKKLFCVVAAAAAMAMLPMSAQAVTLISGTLDISGTVNGANSVYTPAGQVDFNSPGLVIAATGDFDTFVNPGDPVTLYDFAFASAPVAIYSVGGFTFTAVNFTDYDNVSPNLGFTAYGTLSGNGFADTRGIMYFTTQASQINVSFSSTTVTPLPAALPMFASGLGVLGIAGWRKRKKAKLAA
jgi:hypothetical protein